MPDYEITVRYNDEGALAGLYSEILYVYETNANIYAAIKHGHTKSCMYMSICVTLYVANRTQCLICVACISSMICPYLWKSYLTT